MRDFLRYTPVMVIKLRQYAFALILTIAGIIIVAASFCSIRAAHEVADVHAPLVDAAMETKLELALARIVFEEHLSQDPSLSLDAVYFHLNQAKWYARAMIMGGKNSEGTYIPIEDERLRNSVMMTLEGIIQTEEAVRGSQTTIKVGEQGGEINRKFERLFEDTLNRVDLLENELLGTLAKERATQKVIDYTTIFISIALFIGVLIYFVFRRHSELNLISRLNEIATHDELTNIPNRRHFNLTLSNEWNHALRAQYPLSLTICDIDFFKQYNDALGHQAGDECLISVAKVMQSILQRPVDSIARYGGDELAYILPFTNIEGAIAMMQTLHNTLSAEKIPHPDSEISDCITLSVGVASITPDPNSSIEELISAADRQLYRAKEEGRNRTCHT